MKITREDFLNAVEYYKFLQMKEKDKKDKDFNKKLFKAVQKELIESTDIKSQFELASIHEDIFDKENKEMEELYKFDENLIQKNPYKNCKTLEERNKVQEKLGKFLKLNAIIKDIEKELIEKEALKICEKQNGVLKASVEQALSENFDATNENANFNDDIAHQQVTTNANNVLKRIKELDQLNQQLDDNEKETNR
jgi:hypothetical protein